MSMQRRCFLGTLSIIALGIGVPCSPAQDRDAEWIAKRLLEIKRSRVSHWERIPWAASLVEARRLSQDEKRPLFLFSFEGNLKTGNC